MARDPLDGLPVHDNHFHCRPDVVMPCDTVPKRTRGLLASGEMTEAQARGAHEAVPRRLYGA